MRIFSLLILSVMMTSVLIFEHTSDQNYASAQYSCSPIFGGWHPKIATYENNVYVAWDYYHGCGQRTLLLVHSDDNGETFGNPVTLANESSAGSEPAIMASGSNVYVAWTDYMTHPGKLLFKMSKDYGNSFGSTIELSSNDTQENKAVGIVASGDTVGVVWSGYVIGGNGSRVFLSEVAGNSGSVTTSVLSQGAGNSFASQVVQANGKAHVLWVSYGNCDPGNKQCPATSYVTTIDLASNSIAQAVRLDEYAGRIAVSGSTVYAAGIVSHEYNTWKTENGVKVYLQTVGNRTIVFAKSIDDGKTFGGPQVLGTFDDSTDSIDNLALDADQNNVYLTWVDASKPWSSSILMIASTDGGNSFGKTMAIVGPGAYLNGPEPLALQQQVSTSGNSYYAIWQNNPQTLFFRKTSDAGSMLDNATDLQDIMHISNPGCFLASDGNNVYIAGTGKEGHTTFTRSADGGNTYDNAIDLDKNSASTVPEFPFVIPVLLISITSLIVFYKIKIRN